MTGEARCDSGADIGMPSIAANMYTDGEVFDFGVALAGVSAGHSCNLYDHPSDPWSLGTCCKSTEVTDRSCNDAVPVTSCPPDEHAVEAYKYTDHEEYKAPFHAEVSSVGECFEGHLTDAPCCYYD